MIQEFFINGKDLIIAKLRIFSGISKEYYAVVDAEDAAVANLAALAGGKRLNAARASKPGSVSMLESIATVSITTEL